MFPNHVFLEAMIQFRSKIQLLKFIKTFSAVDRINKMQIIDEWHYYNVKIAVCERSLQWEFITFQSQLLNEREIMNQIPSPPSFEKSHYTHQE